MPRLNKLFLMLLLALLFSVSQNFLNASTAYPGLIKFIQPDSSTIRIFLKGDEKVKWAETEDGYTILFNSKGFYEYAVVNSESNLVKSGVLAKNIEERTQNTITLLSSVQKHIRYSSSQVSMVKQIWNITKSERDNSSKSFPQTGSRKLVCILIGYTDLPFTKSPTDFQNLFNQVGYTLDGATGSVKDFFTESSYNQLNLTVDVAGPFTADHTMAYYGANGSNGDDLRPRELVAEAIQKADPTVNYANYDNDGDDYVDGVYVIFAGYGEEAGGGADAIWSHAWGINPVTCDGKIIQRYSCSPELRANSGTNLSRIGVICHEFGHVLGAPDFYDTNYEDGGQFIGTGSWDLQANGSWNGDWGATPAQPNPYTKIYVYNWATANTISSQTNLTLKDAAHFSNSFYRVNTSTAGEYFLLENRQQVGFDTYIPGHGLLIYHVHKDIANGGINTTYPQMMYPICANAGAEPGSTPASYGNINSGGCPFPGTGSKTEFTDTTIPSQKSWAGGLTAKPITNISENIAAKTISLCFMGCTSIPMTYVSCTTTQNNTSSINPNQVNQEILGVQIVMNGNLTPLSATSFTFNTSGSTNPTTDISNAKLYSGTSSLFETSTQFGTTSNSVNGSFTFSGNKTLTDGTNYFWLTYDVPSTATLNNYLDAQCTSLTVGTAKTPTVTNPSGNRQIAISYCTAGATSAEIGYISRVRLNTIDQTSTLGTNGYEDYTSQIATMQIGVNSTIIINRSSAYQKDSVLIWVDWNKDGDFSDVGEKVYSSTTVANSYTTNFAPPSGATIGATRMRIRLHNGTYLPNSTPCGNSYYGEVEDYTINVTPPCTPPTTQATSFSSAAIADNSMTVGWTRGNGSAVLVVARAGSAVNADPVNGTTYTTSAAFGNGTQIGTGNYVVYSGTGTSVNLNSLSTGTTYYYAIYEYNSATNCYLIPALIGNAKTTGATPYCVAGSLATSYEYISNVAMGSINQASGKGTGGYQDYTSQIATMQIGVNNTATITVTNPYSKDQVLIWVDWNQDGDFDEVGENVYASTGSFASPLTTSSFAPPVGAKIGTTRMRIRLHDTSNGPNATSCGNSSYGEVEDYSVNVINAIGNKTINITSGGLSSALTKTEKSLLTNLTITGSIDARDFKILRDSMTLLSVLDISNVTIVAYTGTEGTYSTSSTVYPANEVPADAFYNQSTGSGKISLTSVILPLSATSIGNYAFQRCSGLTSVTIPSSVTSIGTYAFYGCRGLTSITIPSSVTSIGTSAFTYCSKLTAISVASGNLNYSSLDGVLFNKNKSTLIQCPGAKAGSYTIPSSVSTIGDYTFSSCMNLTSVTIPNSVSTIGNDAFWNCNGLSAVTIPSSVTTIGNYAFAYCFNLMGSISIPASVTSIGINAFVGSSEEFIVVTSNPNYSSLNGVLFDKNVTLLIQYPGLKQGNYTIPSSVISIGNSAFGYCSGLTSINIPSSVTTIGDEAFYNCSGLTSIYVNSKPIDISSDVFGGVNTTTCTLYVPYSTKALYTAASNWNSFTNIVESSQGFLLGSNTAKILNVAGSSTTVEIKANVSWTVGSDQSWLTVSPVSGSGNSILTLSSVSQSQTLRTATVTVSSPGCASQTITVSETNGITYCTAGSTATSAEFISNVAVGSINQTSVRGTAGYQDYTSQITTMQKGVNTSSTIIVTNPYSTDQVLIWIDWNQDGDFDEAGENVYASTSSFTSPHTTANFAPPAGAKTGITSMRIRLHDTGAGPNATSCGNSSYGEVEDYSVNVTPPCTPPTIQATSFSSAAIADNSMTLGWTRGNGNAVLVVAKAEYAVDADPVNGTTYTTSAAFGNGTQIGTGNYVVYSGTGTSVNLNSLSTGTTYYYAIYEYNSATNCYLIPALIGNAKTTGATPYCVAGSPATSSEYISNVAIGSINQASGKGTGGYQDYTSLITTMQIGVNTTATIIVTNPYPSDQVLIWIDWNQDGDFDEAGENVYASTDSFASPHTTANFAPPAGAKTGITRMRIRLHDTAGAGPNATPCGNSDYGEVEDYSVNIKQADKTLNITAMLESLYNGGGTMRQAQNALGAQWPTGVADHITVELHSSTTYATLVYSAADVPISITGAATVLIPAIYNGLYYITIKHRNSIETTTTSAVSFAGNTITQSYLSPTSVYGGNLVRMIDLHYAFYGGDVNHDGIIDSGDMTPVENSAALAKTGYLFEDCNGDGLIDSSDMTIIENNAGLAIGASTP